MIKPGRSSMYIRKKVRPRLEPLGTPIHSDIQTLSSATAWTATDVSNALPFLSATSVKRFAFDREDLKPHWVFEKTFPKVINTRKSVTRRSLLNHKSLRPAKYLENKIPSNTFWKDFFKTTIRIQSRPGASLKSRAIMTCKPHRDLKSC